MKIAVLFDGGGLARLGLEQVGHSCIGIELDPWKHYLSKWVGSGNCINDDVRNIDLNKYDAVWASPPCQKRSDLNNSKNKNTLSNYGEDLLDWCLKINKKILWVENVLQKKEGGILWGRKYNANQFLENPIQNRTRIIGGKYKEPFVFREYKQRMVGVCPTITASEYKGGALDDGRASRFYGRRLTLEECAYHQGFVIPKGWYIMPNHFEGNITKWTNLLYETIGNGVPVYMSKAFGLKYKKTLKKKLILKKEREIM